MEPRLAYQVTGKAHLARLEGTAHIFTFAVYTDVFYNFVETRGAVSSAALPGPCSAGAGPASGSRAGGPSPALASARGARPHREVGGRRRAKCSMEVASFYGNGSNSFPAPALSGSDRAAGPWGAPALRARLPPGNEGPVTQGSLNLNTARG